MAWYQQRQHPYVRDQEYDQRVTLEHDRSHLHLAAHLGRLFMLHALIEDGARVNVTTYNGVTPLHDACSSGHLHCAKKLINAGGQSEVYDRSSLHQAACHGHLLLLQSLIDQGVCVNRANCNGVTALHDACQTGHSMCARRIIKEDAQLNAMDIDWHTPMTRACARGKKDCVELLVQSGAKLNISGEKFSPLHCAVAKGCSDSTSILLNAGADVDKLDHNRLGTPLHAASHCHQTECARLLLQAGADPDATRPEDDQTALHVAAAMSAPADTITLLLYNGSKLHAKDGHGKTALELAPMDSEAYGVLRHYQENVPLLFKLCCESVNKSLSNRSDAVKVLPLPEKLKASLGIKK